MHPFRLSIIATLLVSLVSFVGIFVLLSEIQRLSFFQTAMISFAAGALLGDAFFHLLPEHIETFGYEINSILFIFVGILLMLLVEAYFHCSHDSSKELDDEGHDHHHHKTHVLAKVNILGDGVHNFLDGLAIGASFLISPAVGVASTVAVILHEIPQEIADAAVLSYAGRKRVKILTINFLTALTAVLGVVVVFSINSLVEGAEQYLVPIAVGQFIYIWLADLLPEIHKKTGVKKYLLEITTFVCGIGVMYLLTLAE